MSFVRLTAADDGTAILIKPAQVVAVRLNRTDSTIALVVTTKSNYSVSEDVNGVAALMGGAVVGPFTSAIDGGQLWINPAWVAAMRLTTDTGKALVLTISENYTVQEPFDAVVLALSSVRGPRASAIEKKARPRAKA